MPDIHRNVTTPLVCFSCHQPITPKDLTVWLGEVYDGIQEEWPFHEQCSNAPWPLFEVSRDNSEE